MPIRVNLRGLEALNKQLPKFGRSVEQKTAKKTPEIITKNIESGLTGIFAGNFLPRNKPSTIRAKLARGNGDKPLQDDLFLTDHTDWTITKVTGGHAVRPPFNRIEAVFHLQTSTDNRPAYKIMEMPIGYFPDYARRIMINSFNSFMRKYA